MSATGKDIWVLGRCIIRTSYLTAQVFPPVLQHREIREDYPDYRCGPVPGEVLLEHHGRPSASYAVACETYPKLAQKVAEQAADTATKKILHQKDKRPDVKDVTQLSSLLIHYLRVGKMHEHNIMCILHVTIT